MTLPRLNSIRLTSTRLTSYRLVLTALLITGATIALTGCGVLEPATLASPSPTPTIVDTTAYIGEVVDPADTVWVGRDSGGDATTFSLHGDGTVAVAYGAKSYDDPNDMWRVVNGVLQIDVYLDDINGEAQYVGTWNPDTSSIDTVMTASVSLRKLTVTLVQQ